MEPLFFTRGGCILCLHGCLGAMLLPQSYSHSNLLEDADCVSGQLCREIKEFPFSGITCSGRVWRKVLESDAWSVGKPLRRGAQSDFTLIRQGLTAPGQVFMAPGRGNLQDMEVPSLTSPRSSRCSLHLAMCSLHLAEGGETTETWRCPACTSPWSSRCPLHLARCSLHLAERGEPQRRGAQLDFT